ncbi:MAG: GAF domain-containing protein [Endomicrobium sp.]|jgi:transcriptional regulator with GAF, ATPase, and Fis domain|nr:GAF domain-containing protein [Endomicrobium sp.]
MKEVITKYLVFSFLMFISAIMIWGFVVSFWFKKSLTDSLLPIVKNTQNRLSNADVEISKDKKERIKILLTELEKSKEIVTYSLLNEDKNLNYVSGIRKRDNILWALNVVYPVTIGQKIAGWIQLWPSPELAFNVFFSKKNITVLFASFILLVLLIFCLSVSYIVFRFILPISDFRKAVNAIALGNTADIKLKYSKGIWKDTQKALTRLNSKILDMDMTVQTLFSVSSTLTSQVKINRIFGSIMELVQNKFERAKCAVFLPSQDGMLKAAAKRGYSPAALLKGIKIRKGNPVADTYISGKTTMVKGMSGADKEFADYFAGENAAAQMNVALTDENNSAIGVLNISADSQDLFAPDVTAVISTAQKYLSIVLRNAKAYDNMQQNNSRLETEINIISQEVLNMNVKLIRKVRDMKALYDISCFSSAKFDLKQITPFIIQKITELTSFANAAILLEDQASKKFYFTEGSFLLTPQRIAEISFNGGNLGVIKRIKETNAPLVYGDIDAVKREIPEFDEIISINCAVLIPVKVKEKVCGAIIAANKLGAAISDSDILIIEHIAVLFSGILEKIEIYCELKKNIRNLTFLQDISRAVAEASDFDKIIEKIIEVVQRVFQADFCVVMLYDKTRGTLKTHCASFIGNKDNYYDPEVSKDDPDSITAKVFREKRSYLFNDASAVSPIAKKNRIKSAMLAPLIIDGEVIGVIRIGKEAPNAYAREDKILVEMLAKQVAIILKTSNIFRQLSANK